MAVVTTVTGAALTLEGLGVDVSGTVSKVLNGVGSIFGTPRSTKRRRRDRYMAQLHQAGLNQSIGQHSDHYDGAQIFAELAAELGPVVIDVLNESYQNYGDGPELPRRGSQEFDNTINEIQAEAEAMYQPEPNGAGWGGSGAVTGAGPGGPGNRNILFLAAAGVILAVLFK